MEQRTGMSRAAQSYALLTFAFTVPVASSLLMFFGVWQPMTGPSRLKLIIKIVYELAALFGLYLILRKRRSGFSSIGLSFSPTSADIGHSILLFIGTYFATTVAYAVIAILCMAISGHPPKAWRGAPLLFGDGNILVVVFVFVNAFYEEILVRAFLITELESQLANATVAVLASVVLQSSYHTYQGLPNAIALSAAFTVLSLYFVAKRRILPVVLAHLYMDVFAVLMYVRYPHLYR